MQLFELFLPALTAVFCFAATIAAFNFILLNKGAKMNVTWGLIAFGAVTLGVSKLFVLLALPAVWIPYLEATAALSLLVSALHARSLYKGLLK